MDLTPRTDAAANAEVRDVEQARQLSSLATRGAAWMGLSRWANQAASLCVFIVLGRLLTPRAFGLVASAGVVLWLLRVLVDQGFGGVIIQRSTLSREHMDTAFWTSLMVGSLLAAMTAGLAPLIADAYSEPALTGVLRALSVVFVVAALDSTQSALLSREMKFREQAVRMMVANFASGVLAVGLAVLGAGVWALVGQTLALECISVVLLWRLSSWSPSRRFSGACFREMFGFGTKMMLIRMLTNVGANVDNFLIGVVLGPVALGFYVIAFRILLVVNDLLSTALTQVVLSTFSRLQHDLGALNQALYRATGVVAAVSFPIYVGLALVARPVIIALFGHKWTPSVAVTEALTLAGLVQSQTLFTSQYVIALGQVGNELGWTAFLVGAEVIGFAASVRFGIVAVAASLGIVLLIAWPIRMLRLRAWGGLSIQSYLRPYPGLIGATAGMAAVVAGTNLLVSGAASAIGLCIEILAGALSYLALLRVLAPREFRELTAILAGFARRTGARRSFGFRIGRNGGLRGPVCTPRNTRQRSTRWSSVSSVKSTLRIRESESEHAAWEPTLVIRGETRRGDDQRVATYGRLRIPGAAVWFALLLMAQAVAVALSLNDAGGARAVYWVSYSLLVLTAVGFQLILKPTNAERFAIVLMTGVGLYLIKVLSYPMMFTYFDELSHLRTAQDIIVSGHLFHHNPALVVGPNFPGLEIVTSSLVKLSGLSATTCGFLVIGAGRIVFAAGLYTLFSDITRSRRIGGLAAVLYMANPSFLYFDSDFSYESFTLPLATVALVMTLRYMRAENRRNRTAALACALLASAAVVVSHHTTSYLLAAFLLLLCLAATLARRFGGTERAPWLIAAWAFGAAGAWLAFVAPSTVTYLSQVFGPAIDGARNVIFGSSATRIPFSGTTASSTDPTWLRLVGYGSVLVIVASLPLGAVLAWRRRTSAWILASGAVAAAYVPVQLLRLTGAGVESANRASEFLFFGVALILARCAIHLDDARAQPVGVTVRGYQIVGRRPAAAYLGVKWRRGMVLLTAWVVFVGSVIVLWPPYGRLPGRYLPGADIRSITTQGVEAARWLEAEYGPGQRVLTDRSNAQIVAAYGQATPVEGALGSTPVSRVFTSTAVDSLDYHLLSASKTGFILVDTRQASGLPVRGFYFTQGELGGGSWLRPISESALTKFDGARGLSLVYDNGPIQIYSVGRAHAS